MQARNDWTPIGVLIAVGMAVGWIVANVPVADVRLRIVFIMLVAVGVLITSVFIGRLLPGGRDAKLPVRRMVWVAVLFALVAGAGYLIYLRVPVGSWVLLLIAALGFLFVLLRRKWTNSR
jgi:hypothetical protein